MTQMDMFQQELELFGGARKEPAKVPTKDVVTSVFGFGPIPISQVINTITMVDESNRIPDPPRTDLAPAETTTRMPQVTKAKKQIRTVCKGTAETLIKEIKSLMARINLLEDTLHQLEQAPMVGPNGEQLSPAEAQDHHDTLRDQVSEEIQAGSIKHLVQRSRSKVKELLLLLLDYPVFLLAMFAVFNVSLRLLFAGDGATIILGITAAIFALLGTFLYGYAMRSFGRRHRVFKNADGAITAHGTTRTRIRIEQVTAIGITVAAAAVMALRIWKEGIDAEAPISLILALATLFAVLLGVSGYINYMSEYEHGSDTVDRVQHLSVQLSNRASSTDNLKTQISLLIEETGMKIATLNRVIRTTLEQATNTVTTSAADKAITLARSYHTNVAALPAPDLSSPTLALTIEQANELQTHHNILKHTRKEN